MIPLALPFPVTEAPETDPRPASRLHAFHDEYVLGTRLRVLVNSACAELATQASRAARNEIDRLNLVFNDRLEDSELSRLNRLRTLVASPDLYAVLELAEMWRGITRGAFDGRMGELLQRWKTERAPDRDAVEQTRYNLSRAHVSFDPKRRAIELSPTVQLSLDAIAKGFIVDAALNAARRAAPAIDGFAIEIGGDIRCWGDAPGCAGWRIGIPDAKRPADNAALVDAVLLKNAAIATSGRGPRDCVGDGYRSPTISPFTGLPVENVISASVVSSHVADADAIATACLVLSPSESIALVDRLDGVAARITDVHGQFHESAGWKSIRLAATTPNKSVVKKTTPIAEPGSADKPPQLPTELRWPNDWEIGIRYVAPERKENERAADFRSPYMAVWITDEQNRPVHTTIMVGQDPQWQRDNYIWWSSYRDRAKQIIDLVSQATALSGRYRIFWGGVDNNWHRVPIGKYTLHLETSQERGKHSYRSVPLEIGRERFKKQLENLPESGGLEITYGHYNDRFELEE